MESLGDQLSLIHQLRHHCSFSVASVMGSRLGLFSQMLVSVSAWQFFSRYFAFVNWSFELWKLLKKKKFSLYIYLKNPLSLHEKINETPSPARNKFWTLPPVSIHVNSSATTSGLLDNVQQVGNTFKDTSSVLYKCINTITYRYSWMYIDDMRWWVQMWGKPNWLIVLNSAKWNSTQLRELTSKDLQIYKQKHNCAAETIFRR